MSGPAPALRYELRSAQQLSELAAEPLNGVRSGSPSRTLHRDLYLDTPDDALRRRGVECRLRLASNDTRVLSLTIAGQSEDPPQRVDSAVAAAEVDRAVAENTQAGRRLRALLDPALLTVRLDLEVERITREADFDWIGRPRLELHYDAISVRRGEIARTFHQLCVHTLRGAPAKARAIGTALERDHNVRATSSGARERAELLLRWSARETPAAPEAAGEPARAEIAGSADAADVAGLPDFLNPELSLLEFQKRVLSLAEDHTTPLRERLRFLAIVSENLDEFFMVRMAGLRQAAREQYEEQCEDGLTRGQQVELIVREVDHIIERQAACARACLQELDAFGVRILSWSDLDADERAALRRECRDEIQPGLTPMAMTLSPGHPLPHLPHLTLSLAVVQRGHESGRLHLAEVEIPSDSPRFMPVPGRERQVVPIEEVVRSNLDLVYPGADIRGAYVFRVTRGGDLALDEDAAEDLIEAVATAAGRRPQNPAVRVEIERAMPPFARNMVLESLRRELGAREAPLSAADFQEVEGLLDLRSLVRLPLPAAPALTYPPFEPRDPLPPDVSFFDAIRERDLLYHQPFVPFSSTVLRFIREAALDDQVTAIKITLYRAGDPAPVVEALLEAARRGKKVVAFVELKARFDEEHNVAWARKLEQAGGHVVSGLVGLKNHAKVALVVRREDGRLRRYAHIGTGNYNARSGREYTDLSLFSAREELVCDMADLFNALTGGSLPPRGLTRGALIAPHQLLDAILARIDREAAHARAGRSARITAKLNGLSDADVVRALLRAARDGVEVDLVVRGICTLRPGLPGRSDGIRIVSVVGRFLEHSRIYRFENGGTPEYLIGSADLRPRNLRRRIELLVPVVDAAHHALLDTLLDSYLADATAWELRPDGSYAHRQAGGPGTQEILLGTERAAVSLEREAKQAQRVTS